MVSLSRFEFDDKRRRNLANLIITSGLLALAILLMVASRAECSPHELTYVQRPGAALGFVLEVVYPCLAIASLVACLAIRKQTPAWVTAILVPPLATATIAALAAFASILARFDSRLEVSSLLFHVSGASLLFLLVCAYLLGWRRAWRQTVSDWSPLRACLAVFTSLFVLAAIPGVPATIATHVERSNLSALISSDPETVRSAVERVRPWVAWTRLEELRTVARDPANESGGRAARACELLTGVNPRVAGSRYPY